MYYTVKFSVMGYIKQRVKLTEKMTKKEFEEALNKGKILTTVQEDGEVIMSDCAVIGKVVSVDNNLEYEDFEVE